MATTKIGNFHNSASIGPICLILVLIKMFGGQIFHLNAFQTKNTIYRHNHQSYMQYLRLKL